MTVYAITDGECIKIGISKDVRSRIKELQTGNPRNLVLWGEFDADGSDEVVEAELHLKLAGHRVRGEWFWDCEEVRNTFLEVAQDYRFAKHYDLRLRVFGKVAPRLEDCRCNVCLEPLRKGKDVVLFGMAGEWNRVRFAHIGKCHTLHDREMGLWSWFHFHQWRDEVLPSYWKQLKEDSKNA